MLRKLKYWGPRASLSIIDQAVNSGANFLFNIFLIRNLSPSEYGEFAITFSILLFMTGFHNALILEPMSTIGPRKYTQNIRSYFKILILFNIFLGLLLLSILLSSSIILQTLEYPLYDALLGLAFSIIFILLFWFFRRLWYIIFLPTIALVTSVIYFLLLILFTYVFYEKAILTSFSAFIIIGLSSIIASLVSFVIFKIYLRNQQFSECDLKFKNVARNHWMYGRWVVGSAFVHWSSSTVYVPLIGAIISLSTAGVYKALQYLFLPMNQVITALGLLLLPQLSGKSKETENRYIYKLSLSISLLFLVMAIGYFVALIIFGEIIINILYDDPYYTSYLWMLPWLGLIVIISSIKEGMSLGLKALRNPQAIFWAQTAGSIATLSVGILLTWYLSIKGALFGNIISGTIGLILILFFWNRLLSSITVSK